MIKIKTEVQNLMLSLEGFTKIFCIIFTFAIFGCKNPDVNEKSNNLDQFPSQGKYNADSLEIGEWRFFDSHLTLLEKGNFINGIRRGLWVYYPNHDSIIWNEVYIKDILIRTNLPDFLKLFEFDGESAVFKHSDTGEAFSLLIGKGHIPENMSYSAYNQEIYKIIDSKNEVVIDSLSETILTSNGRSFLYNYIIVQGHNKNSFITYNLVGRTTKNESIEIVLRCSSKCDRISRKVFYSIIPNLFVDNERFLPLKEKIVGYN